GPPGPAHPDDQRTVASRATTHRFTSLTLRTGSQKARGTSTFVEGHRMAAVVMEDRPLSLDSHDARLVGVAPACRRIAVTVVQRFVCNKE
ncbi:hypothetical protein, partial [Arthrobacter sp. Hiyo1]|uniref:hypothetical protein n=1 Tax=Arthrobacter sp. Hiyo1 TaxID=1588020 RepID=UPI000AB1C211